MVGGIVSLTVSGPRFSVQAASKLLAVQTVMVVVIGDVVRGAVVEIVLIEAGYMLEATIDVVAMALFIAVLVFSTNFENLLGCVLDSFELM